MKTMLLAAMLAVAAAAPATAANLLTNGDFETGDYSGWIANVQSGSGGNLQVTTYSGVSPISGSATANNASGGTYYSITDQSGPGSYSLTQAFTIATAGRVTIKFDMFATNQAGADFNNGLDYTVGQTQNAVVDILTGTAGAFTETPGDILATLYGPGSDGFAAPQPWLSYSTAIFLNAGTYQIRFAEADNQLFFQQGVDNVSVTAGVPEASSWAMMITGFGLMGFAARRRRALAAA